MLPIVSKINTEFSVAATQLGRHRRGVWRSAGMKGRGKMRSPTNGIVRHGSHMRKSGVTRPGIEPGWPWWEASGLTAQPPWPRYRKGIVCWPSRSYQVFINWLAASKRVMRLAAGASLSDWSNCSSEQWHLRNKIMASKAVTGMLQSNRLPKSFKSTKIVAVQKPGKPADLPESYRPIALLSVMLKLFERLIYNRISPVIDRIIPPVQVDFRNGRSCTDQILTLTNFIEEGFQRKLKTGVVFVDLTAACNTIWKKDLLYKLLKVIPCITTCDLICNLLSNIFLQVFINRKRSSLMRLNNELPQESVLALLLFNLYLHDLPPSIAREFMYADDIAYAIQITSFEQLSRALTNDLKVFVVFCKHWRLKPSVTKPKVACFHLNNIMVNAKLEVDFDGQPLKHNYKPEYLGVVLDRTLSWRHHHEEVKASCLRISSLALVYAVAGYCFPVWINSSHMNLSDVQLNSAMRTICGAVRSTPVIWLTSLSNILPPDIRRQKALLREYWQQRWTESNISSPLFTFGEERKDEFMLDRKLKCTLNRLRTGHGRCNSMLNKWRLRDDPSCPCGHGDRTIRHLLLECPQLSYPEPNDDIKDLSADAIKVIVVIMEQRWNERAGETGDPRENPLTNGIVRHDRHVRKSEVTRPGLEPGSPWWEAGNGAGFSLDDFRLLWRYYFCLPSPLGCRCTVFPQQHGRADYPAHLDHRINCYTPYHSKSLCLLILVVTWNEQPSGNGVGYTSVFDGDFLLCIEETRKGDVAASSAKRTVGDLEVGRGVNTRNEAIESLRSVEDQHRRGILGGPLKYSAIHQITDHFRKEKQCTLPHCNAGGSMIQIMDYRWKPKSRPSANQLDQFNQTGPNADSGLLSTVSYVS
ncbi:hypothetical protein PR048_002876 [Dryococelus australis]|uniref:Reverse transcriptase domain-containing protein n=1 Tax=Dryococelus australis TaxID=614101 RepID=A0ABQ9ILH5_9NEOP|nr:hypothetical protein PR048_002876 [Dryococelus australis]